MKLLIHAKIAEMMRMNFNFIGSLLYHLGGCKVSTRSFSIYSKPFALICLFISFTYTHKEIPNITPFISAIFFFNQPPSPLLKHPHAITVLLFPHIEITVNFA